ncbi:MAG TPA: SRPBCC family protein [Solirubrobacteraceae bacterium]|nr:SRPBCC family protein [Solirubrobacteraceae bacterium]
MPTACRSRTIAAPAREIWEVVSDPHHLPRWWPRVERVEDVRERAFTEVMRTRKGKLVRADFDVVSIEGGDQGCRVRWDQRIEGTPFASVLRSCEIELRLVPVADAADEARGAAATEVTIELRQELRKASARIGGSMPRAGSFLVRRAARATVGEALAGLERISG